MKFLADMGVSMTVVQALREQNYDAIHLREQGLQRLPDPTILIKAKQENRIILTFDLDFSELLAINRENLPGVVIFRLQKNNPPFCCRSPIKIFTIVQRKLDSRSYFDH
jgi:predicted nuclease of predicted toxin-antitoxin system